MPEPPLLAVSDLAVHFFSRRSFLNPSVRITRAVDGVSFTINAGETLGLVGESGCGKTTTGRATLRLIEPTFGAVRLDGVDVLQLSGEELRKKRRLAQIVFQDPFSSLNPRHRIRDILRAPLDIHGIGAPREREARIVELMLAVGLRPDQLRDYPHEFSGGQRQRIGIARALALSPKLIICDEPVSALDVSVQAQILNLLMRLRREFGLAYLFISHDLAVVRHIADNVAVMYAGRIVEYADTETLFARPVHPYTELLLASTPAAHPRERRAATTLPSTAIAIETKGCAFSARCPLANGHCRAEAPPLTPRGGSRLAACHHR